MWKKRRTEIKTKTVHVDHRNMTETETFQVRNETETERNQVVRNETETKRKKTGLEVRYILTRLMNLIFWMICF